MSQDELKEDIEYRPFSIGAILSFVLAFSAPLTFIDTSLVIVPFGAVVLAITSFFRIKNSNKPMVGGRLALIAIALAITVSSFAITYKVSRENRMYGLARQYADEWFALILEKDLYRVHQLTKQPEAKVNVDADDHLEAYYDEEFVLVRHKRDAPDKPINDLNNLLSLDPVHSLVRLSSRNQLKHVVYLRREPGRYYRELDREIFTIVYEISPSIHKPGEPLVLRLMMERARYDAPIGVQWRVTQREYISGGPKQELVISGG